MVTEAEQRWQRAFERDGVVAIRAGRGLGAGLVAAGLVFAAAAAFLLAIPRAAGPLPLALLRAGGGLGVLLAAVGVGYGLATLARPPVVVRVDREGVTPSRGPRVPWSEVVDAGVWTAPAGGGELPVLRVSASYRQRADRSDARAGGLHRRARWVGADRLLLGMGARGGAGAVQRFLLWARDRVGQQG